MKVLRLFVTDCIKKDFPNNIKGVFDVPNEVVPSFDYEEIVICGGEPLVFKKNLIRLLQSFFTMGEMTGIKRKVLVETSLCDFWIIDDILKYCDGIICTPKTKDDMAYFKQLNNELLKGNYYRHYEKKDLRLNILPCVKHFFPENLKVWQIQEFPSDEIVSVTSGDYFRIANLWEDDNDWYSLTR